jgi:hypothetical protein
MGRLYDAYVEVGPRFAGMGDVKNQGDKAGKEYGKALADAAVKAAKANARNLGAALAKARSAEADAAGKVRVAETQLAEARKKYGAASSQAISAEERLAAAQRKSAAAADTSKHATEALGKAQSQVAAAAADAGKRSGGRFTGAFKGALSKIGGEKEGRQVATRFGVGMNGAIGGVVSRSAGVFVAGFAAIKSAQVFGTFINDARESAKVARVSAQVIKSTGGAAKITAAQMGDLATSISNKTGADDEDVQSGENLLATFTNVRNEVGKNNDIFNRASQAAVDMASAMNNGVVDANGLKSANIQLGKALNDPVKGVTALSKVGVSFTAKQKEQIKTLVDSGKTLQAQKIILAEVGKEFGGAAAAAADPLTRLKTIAGNLSESVGGLLLPAFNKVVNIVSNTFIPGIYALGAAFKEGDVTSDGFVGVMERIGVAARTAFGFFKTEVLPRLKEFGAFIIGTVVPAVGSLASNLISSFAPAIKDVFGFFKTEVLPRLKDFAGFLGDSVLPKVASLATALSKNKDFLVPFAATILAVVAAMKAWAIVQGILNVVMSANPVGLVIVAIAALVAGIIYAYKNSDKFRAILQGAFQGIQKAAQIMAPLVKAAIDIVIGVFSLWWNYFAKPILKNFGAALQVAWQLAQKFGGFVAAAFDGIKAPALAAIKFVIDKFLGFVGTILEGASKAFGWVPEMGGKLKNAAKEFGKFRDGVNNALAGVTDQTVNVAIKYSSTGVNLSTPSSVGRRARGGPGGPVNGPGTTTSDTAGLYALSNREWVIKAASSMKYGDRAMAAVNAGKATIIPDGGFATGGSPGLRVKTALPSSSKLAKEVASHAVLMSKPYVAALAKELNNNGIGGPPGSVQNYRGVKLNTRTIRMLNNAERILGAVFHITQGSYSTSVAASGSTHAGGGAMDTNGPRGWNAAVKALRLAGFAAWHRTPSQGPWRDHIHSIALGDSSASPAAKAQMASFRRGGDGLGHGMFKGGKVLVRDQGGPLPHGMFAYNGSGKTERVLTAEQDAARRGTTVVVNVSGVVGMTKQDLRNYLVKEIDGLRKQGRI